MKNKILFLPILYLLFSSNIPLWSQDSTIIDVMELKDYKINVVFYNPYSNLIKQNPTFIDLDYTSQLEVWDNYLLRNVIYDFQLTTKEKIITHYIVKGNSTKTVDKKNLPRNTIYQLDIVKHDESINYYFSDTYQHQKSLTVDKLNYYGTLFESMQVIQDEINAGRNQIAYNFFGRYRLPISYQTILYSTLSLIADDLNNVIPYDLIAKDKSKYENPFIEYQQCIFNYFKIDRIEKVYVRQYNIDGSLQDEFPRLEVIEDIFRSINDTSSISGVTSLPFFLKNDSIYDYGKNGSLTSYKLASSDQSIKKYLEDIIISKNNDGDIEQINATLLLHEYSIKGHQICKERYVAYFKKFDNCFLPYKVLFSDIEDEEFQKPRIVTEIDYLFYKK